EAPQDAATASTDETVAADEHVEHTTPPANDAPFQRPASQPGAAGATRPRFIGAPTPTASPRPRVPATSSRATSSRATEPRRNWFANALGWKVATLAALAAAVTLAIINAQMLREAGNFTNQVATLQQHADDLQTQVTTLESDKSDLEVALAAASTAAEGSTDEVANQLAALQEEVAKLQAENQQIRADYNELLLQQASTEQQLVEFAQAQTLVPIFGTEDTPDALGGLFSGPEGNLIALRGLDTLPAEQTYELWLIDADGTPVPAGLLGADAPAQTAIRVELPGLVEEYTAVAVSIEPAAGSEQPTGPIVMVGTRT
ncbi:MAG: anti-sigma factor, partial [Caldilineaceae bacterium]|nr:anti-sigma factor [Caldilineaceae bacterium]